MAIAVILGILFMGLTIGGAIFGGIKLYSSLSDYGNHTGEKGHTVIGIISIIVAVVCLILFIFIPFSYHQVDEGETAVLGLTEIDAEGSEKIKSNITADEASLIAEYLKYIEYLATWDGKLPEVMTDGNTLIQVPTGNN
ncbi:MAG: hypothetical protein J6A25_07350 [Lachnospiraceae bacterium]|nr:hypothetical protein [Lachnospiraceae bacterium]